MLILLSNVNGFSLLLEPLVHIEKSCVNHQRCFMYINDKMTLLTNTTKLSLPKLIHGRYCWSMGKALPNWKSNLSGRKSKLTYSPIVDHSSLFNCTSVYVFCPSTLVRISLVLRFLRKLVDYSHNGHMAALYGSLRSFFVQGLAPSH